MPFNIYKRRKTWFVDFTIDGHRFRKSLKISNKSLAIQIANTTYENALKILHGIPRDITLQDASDLFMEYSRINNKSHINDQIKSKVVLEYFGPHTLLQDIKPSDIERFRGYLQETRGLSKASINRYRAFLSSVYNRAINDDKYEGKNPVEKVRPYKEKSTKIFFTID